MTSSGGGIFRPPVFSSQLDGQPLRKWNRGKAVLRVCDTAFLFAFSHLAPVVESSTQFFISLEKLGDLC
jgi:hypothetical protein